MVDTTTVDSLNGLFKQTYADKISMLVPSWAVIRKATAFVKNDQLNGDYYNVPAVLQNEAGATYAAAGAGAFDLNPISTMVMKNAQVLGSQIAFKSAMATEAAMRAVKSGASAFESATKLQIKNIIEAHNRRIELGCYRGQSTLGIVDSGASVNATTADITFTKQGWSTGMWAGQTGAFISLFNSSNGDILNQTQKLIVTRVTSSTRVLRITGAVADISDILTYLAGADADINFFGARLTGNVYNEAAGLVKIITNTGSLFGIDAGVYDLWRGTNIDVGAVPLDFGTVQNGIAEAVSRGGLSSKTTLLLSPFTWSDLASDEAALRKYDSSYSRAKFENGAEALRFNSQAGELEVISHPFMLNGEALAVPFETCIRPGATDQTFDIPGQEGSSNYWQKMENNMGFYTMSYSNSAYFCAEPAKTLRFFNITNTNDA